jgi:hypothetical protein
MIEPAKEIWSVTLGTALVTFVIVTLIVVLLDMVRAIEIRDTARKPLYALLFGEVLLLILLFSVDVIRTPKQAVATIDRKIEAQVTQETDRRVETVLQQPFIYIQIAAEDQRKDAQALATKLDTSKNRFSRGSISVRTAFNAFDARSAAIFAVR